MAAPWQRNHTFQTSKVNDILRGTRGAVFLNTIEVTKLDADAVLGNLQTARLIVVSEHFPADVQHRPATARHPELLLLNGLERPERPEAFKHCGGGETSAGHSYGLHEEGTDERRSEPKRRGSSQQQRPS